MYLFNGRALAQLIAWAGDWQSLIAGLLAIAAALIAARPVWRQLQRMETQSNIMLRQMLLLRLSEIESRQEAIHGCTRESMRAINNEIGPDGEVNEISAESAFHMEQYVHTAISELKHFQAKNLDDPPTEVLKRKLITALGALSNCLGDIHRPTSTDQEDEGISDAEWQKVIRRGETAPIQLPTRYARVASAIATLDKNYEAEGRRMREKLLEVDQALLV